MRKQINFRVGRASFIVFSAFKKLEQNEHGFPEGQITKPAARIDEAVTVGDKSAADAQMNSKGFHRGDNQQQKARRPGSFVQHQPDAVQQKQHVADKIHNKDGRAAVDNNNLLAFRMGAALLQQFSKILQEISDSVSVDEMKHAYADKK